MSVANLGFNANVVNLLQDRTLERVFHDSLVPRFIFRAAAMPEEWVANIGQRQVFTRAGLLPVDLQPLTPGQDPTPASYATEQWEVEATQYGKPIDSAMPLAHVALASTFVRDTQTLGIHAAQTMNRLVRNRLFVAYLGGNTCLTAAALINATQVAVANLNGFTEVVVNGRVQPVSPANPLPIRFTNPLTGAQNTVVGATPNVPSEPFGPGVLTLGSALGAGLALRVGVFASSGSVIIRTGGGLTVDALVAGNILTLNDVISAVALLRSQNVPTTSDGTYHVHLTPQGEAQLQQDNYYQRMIQSIPDHPMFRDAAIGRAVGCTFFRNNELPDPTNSGTLRDSSGGGGSATSAPQIGGEVINQAGVTIRRELVLGGACIYEKFLDESKYITEAGVTGKIGEFSVVNNSVQIMTQRIRYILRAPLDRLQQVVSQAWSWSGDFAIPSDLLVGNAARFKRAVVIEHA